MDEQIDLKIEPSPIKADLEQSVPEDVAVNQIDPSVDLQPESIIPSPLKTMPSFMLDEEEKSKKDLTLEKVLRLYVLPIIALSVFGGILVLLILPRIGQIFAKLDQMSTNNEVIADLDAEITELQQLVTDSAQTTQDLEFVNAIAPTGITEVVNFREKIIQIAKLNGMKVGEANTGEQALTLPSDESEIALGTIEIPSNFTVSGTLPQAKAFIEDVKKVDDFVIIGEMQLQSAESILDVTSLSQIKLNNWVLQISLVKYQFQPLDDLEQLEQIYLRIPPLSKPDQDTMEFIRARAIART